MGKNSQKIFSIIRWSLLVCGITISCYVSIINWGYDSNLLSFLGSTLWDVWPYIVYIILARRANSVIFALIPGITICSINLYGLITYLNSTSSTSGLIFIFLPIIEAVSAVLAFFLVIFIIAGIDRMKNKRLEGEDTI